MQTYLVGFYGRPAGTPRTRWRYYSKTVTAANCHDARLLSEEWATGYWREGGIQVTELGHDSDTEINEGLADEIRGNRRRFGVA